MVVVSTTSFTTLMTKSKHKLTSSLGAKEEPSCEGSSWLHIRQQLEVANAGWGTLVGAGTDYKVPVLSSARPSCFSPVDGRHVGVELRLHLVELSLVEV